MIQQCMTYVDETPNRDARLALIVTLRDITGRLRSPLPMHTL